MKNIKTFEELNYDTYKSASDKMNAFGQTKKAEEISQHADKIAKMGIGAINFDMLVGTKKYPNAKFNEMKLFKSGDAWMIQTVFKSGESNVHRINAVVSENGDIKWNDGNKFADKKSVYKFQNIIQSVSKYQQDFIKFLSKSGLTTEDLKVVPRTFYE